MKLFILTLFFLCSLSYMDYTWTYRHTDEVIGKNHKDERQCQIPVNRDEWSADEPKKKLVDSGKPRRIVLDHSFLQEECVNVVGCIEIMKRMQQIDQTTSGLSDIRYKLVTWIREACTAQLLSSYKYLKLRIGKTSLNIKFIQDCKRSQVFPKFMYLKLSGCDGKQVKSFCATEDGNIYEGTGWHSRKEERHVIKLCFIGNFSSHPINDIAITSLFEFLECSQDNGLVATRYVVRVEPISSFISLQKLAQIIKQKIGYVPKLRCEGCPEKAFFQPNATEEVKGVAGVTEESIKPIKIIVNCNGCI